MIMCIVLILLGNYSETSLKSTMLVQLYVLNGHVLIELVFHCLYKIAQLTHKTALRTLHLLQVVVYFIQ